MTSFSLDEITKLSLIPEITPLHSLPTLSQQLDASLYVKRDDLTGIGAGGNKGRKLEYLLADAKAQGAVDIVTGGGLQSNHAAMTAACCKKLGMNCHLALVDAVPISSQFYQHSGNVFLDKLYGANITRFAAGKSSNDCIQMLAKDLAKTKDYRPYIVPMGGSNAIGALGYVQGALEIITQLKQRKITIDSVVVASGSAGTQAGLIVGMILANSEIRVQGMSVFHPAAKLHQLILEICQQLAGKLNIQGVDWHNLIHISDDFIGEGYGLPAESTWQAMDRLMAAELISSDPVYTGKALDGWFSWLDNKRPEIGGRSLFVHTGGLAGMFGYAR